jgi:hypothetical protein
MSKIKRNPTTGAPRRGRKSPAQAERARTLRNVRRSR